MSYPQDPEGQRGYAADPAPHDERNQHGPPSAWQGYPQGQPGHGYGWQPYGPQRYDQGQAAWAPAPSGWSYGPVGSVERPGTVLAAFAQRGRNWARIALTAVGGVFIAAQLLSILTGSPQALLGLIWIGLGIALFWVGDANAWYRQVRSLRSG